MSKVTLELTAKEREKLIADARRDLVERLYSEHAEDIQTISKARLATVAKWLTDREER